MGLHQGLQVGFGGWGSHFEGHFLNIQLFLQYPKMREENWGDALLIFTVNLPKLWEILTFCTVASPFLNFGYVNFNCPEFRLFTSLCRLKLNALQQEYACRKRHYNVTIYLELVYDERKWAIQREIIVSRMSSCVLPTTTTKIHCTIGYWLWKESIIIPAVHSNIGKGNHFWSKTEWNLSRQLVCANGEACLIPFTILMLFNTLHNFSYACEPAFQIKTNIKMSKH